MCQEEWPNKSYPAAAAVEEGCFLMYFPIASDCVVLVF